MISRNIYRIDDLHVDVRRRTVTRRGQRLDVSETSLRLLLALIKAAPGYLSTERCLEEVWKDRVVGTEAVSQRVLILRRALGDSNRSPRYIESSRGLGYRLKSNPSEVASSVHHGPASWGTLLVMPDNGGNPLLNGFLSTVAEMVGATPWRVVPPEAFDLRIPSGRSLNEMAHRTGATHTLVTQPGENGRLYGRVLNNLGLNLIATIELDATKLSDDSAMQFVRRLQAALWGDEMTGDSDRSTPRSAWSAIVGVMRLLARPRPPLEQLRTSLLTLTRSAPDCAIAHALLANLALKPHTDSNGYVPDLARAREHIDVAIGLAPADLTVQRLASMTTRLLGAHDEAELHAVAAAQSSLHLDELLAVKIGRGELESALDVARQLVRTHQSDVQFHGVGLPSHDYQPLLRISCLMALLDRWEDALTWSRRLVSHFPHSVLSLSVHANVLAELGEVGASRRTLRDLYELKPDWELSDAIIEWHKIYPADQRLAARLYGGLERAIG